MKIVTVRYGRNFYIGHSSKEMEYFNFEAQINEGENEKAVIGELFFKIMKLHEVFEEYRETLFSISSTYEDIERERRYLKELRNELADLEKIEQKLKAAKGFEEIQKLQAELCKLRDKKQLQKRILEQEQEIEELEMKLDQLQRRKVLLENKIKTGDF